MTPDDRYRRAGDAEPAWYLGDGQTQAVTGADMLDRLVSVAWRVALVVALVAGFVWVMWP